MGLDDIVRAGVALADSITTTLQVAVSHEAWTGQDAFGEATYAAATFPLAIVEQKVSQVRSRLTGQMIMTKAKVSFLRPIAPNGAAGRAEPVDTRDRITLPDGFTGPIVAVNSLTDPTTSRGYLTEVYLG